MQVLYNRFIKEPVFALATIYGLVEAFGPTWLAVPVGIVAAIISRELVIPTRKLKENR
jgi:hypothetical protein